MCERQNVNKYDWCSKCGGYTRQKSGCDSDRPDHSDPSWVSFLDSGPPGRCTRSPRRLGIEVQLWCRDERVSGGQFAWCPTQLLQATDDDWRSYWKVTMEDGGDWWLVQDSHLRWRYHGCDDTDVKCGVRGWLFEGPPRLPLAAERTLSTSDHTGLPDDQGETVINSEDERLRDRRTHQTHQCKSTTPHTVLQSTRA